MNKLKAIGAMCIALFVIFVLGVPTAVSYQDDEYIAWSIEKFERAIFNDRMGREALSEGDLSSLKLYSDLSYNFYSDALAEIDKFDVSPGYLSKAKDEHKACYEDKKWASYYTEKAADAFLSGDIDGCLDFLELARLYRESSIEHLDKALEYMEKYLEEIENAPRSTPKKIHTPESIASIFIDSDSDGVPDNKDYAPYDPNIKSQSDFILIWLGTFVVIAAIIVVGYFVIKRKSKIK